MPNYQNKTKDELIEMLHRLLQKYDSLKTSYSKDISEIKQLHQTLAHHSDALLKLNDFSIGLSKLSLEDDLEGFIARQLKEITGAEVTIFSEFNFINRTITAKHIEIQPGLLKKIVSLLGKQVKKIHSEVSDEMYREMTTEIIGMRRTLFEASFGAISPKVGASVQALLDVDRFIGIAYLIEGKLYGTSLLAMRKDKPDPPREILENFCYLAAVSLRRRQAEDALRESQQHLNFHINNSPLATIEWNTDFVVTRWSGEAENIFGWNQSETIGKPIMDLKMIYDEDIPIVLKTMEQLTEGFSKYIVSTNRNLTKDRKIIICEWYNSVMLNPQGKMISVMSQVLDITERKQGEEEIRKSKKLLEDLHTYITDIREDERSRISREIHDQIGQSLTALKLDLNQMHKYINANPDAETKLESMVDLISDTIKDVQRISSDLRPGILDELGLVSAIEWYCDEFEKRTGIKCNLKLDDSDYSDSQINLTFFRVLQETLTNVIRHAKASSVRIKLNKLKKGVTMTVQDNGIGIHEKMIGSAKSLGLISMRERVKQFNGTIDISSKEGNGTKLIIFIPS
jgi:PAS domain S-box-containing protein